MLELALCFTAFLLLTIGSMEFGWGIYAYNLCAASAQDAGRWASVRGSHSSTPAALADIQAYVQSEAVGLDPSLLTVTVTWMTTSTWTSTCSTSDSPITCSTTTPTGFNDPGDYVVVTVNYIIKPLAGLALKQNINVSSTSQYVISN